MLTSTTSARAADVVEEWASIKVPPAPQLKPVTVDPRTTALLMLDFMNQNCGQRPRCVASLPAMKVLLEKARGAGVAVVYTLIANTTIADVRPEVAAMPGEPSVLSGPNKFLRTDLEKILKDKGITTVIAVGTAANGAVLATASAAALSGMNVIIPVDGISSADAYADQYTTWHFANAPGVAPKSTLTRSDMIKF
ncbi:MAG: isochorismatase family protein [Pseudorhodoplanes sp.]|nr:isochorismatase family protein [Pseudorhodoplanes sp.]